MRLTQPAVQVALVLLERPKDRHYGYETAREACVRTSAAYMMLHRWFDEGLLGDGFEDGAAHDGNPGPARRYYELTPKGLAELGGLVERARSDRRFKSLVPGWIGRTALGGLS